MIEIIPYSNLDNSVKEELEDYISNEFGHIPIVNETEWAKPDWTILYKLEDKIVTFYNIVERHVIIDGKELKVAGINNVITPKDFRGKGYATKALTETESFIFDDLGCDLGILLCADDLIPYYQKLKWYTVKAPVFFNQSSGRKKWRANIMLRTIEGVLNPRDIDLNGLPW